MQILPSYQEQMLLLYNEAKANNPGLSPEEVVKTLVAERFPNEDTGEHETYYKDVMRHTLQECAIHEGDVLHWGFTTFDYTELPDELPF